MELWVSAMKLPAARGFPCRGETEVDVDGVPRREPCPAPATLRVRISCRSASGALLMSTLGNYCASCAPRRGVARYV